MKFKILLVLPFFLTLTFAQAQFKKYILLEHYTQASCGPCASQNPLLEEVRQRNLVLTHHVAYHTSFPGTDPMYDFNKSDSNDRLTYHGIQGVPTVIIDGAYSASPGSITDDVINANTKIIAPVRVKVNADIDTSDVLSAKVELSYADGYEGGNLYLHATVVERNVNYTFAPGSNGEKYFPNVMRKMLTPARTGIQIDFDAEGTTINLDDYSIPAELDKSELYVIAWLEDKEQNLVLNSGSSIDPNWSALSLDDLTLQEGESNHEFTGKYYSDTAGDTVQVRLDSDMPSDWSATILIDGEEVDSDTQFVLDSTKTEAGIKVIVTPGETNGVYNHTIYLDKVDEADIEAKLNFTSVSNVTDIILDHGPNANRWNENIIAGLNQVENRSHGIMPVTQFIQAYYEGSLRSVKNVYNNTAWTFPAFVYGETEVLADILDNGGNLFIAGQDIGWDTWDNQDNVNISNRNFYTNYLSTNYIGDGNGTNNKFIPTDDAIYSRLSETTIRNVNGGSNIYPEDLAPIGENASAIFTYGTNKPAGGIRNETDTYKTVYLGVDLGMISNEDVRNRLISVTNQYFEGIISKTKFDQAIAEAIGQNYPNPAVSYTKIEFPKLSVDATLKVMNINGSEILSTDIKAGESAYNLDVNTFDAGNYIYYLQTESGISVTHKFQVIK